MAFSTITVNADQTGGRACVRGLRIPVATIVTLVPEGMTVPAVRAEYPDLVADDARESLLFAAAAVTERGLPRRMLS